MKRILDAWYSLPLGARAAIVDAVETGVGAALSVQFTLPTTFDGFARLAAILAGAFAGATVSALRRKAQAAIAARQAGRLIEGS